MNEEQNTTWELEFEWLKVRHYVKEHMKRDKLPDLNAVLFLIGIQELGAFKDKFTKEEKQDLMHLAICELLSADGFYKFIGRDDEGWPHYEPLRPISAKGLEAQELLIKTKIISYFNLK